MEIRFSDGEGMEDTMCVEPNSIIKDVLKEFLVRNGYYEDPDPNMYAFEYHGIILNGPKFIDRRIKFQAIIFNKFNFNIFFLINKKPF